MKKRTIILGIMMSSLMANATSLQAYRESRSEFKTEKHEGGKGLADELISRLGGKLELSKDLTNVKALESLNAPVRISFSNSIKRYLDVSGGALSRDMNMEKASTFNPQWSREQTRSIKAERQQKVCNQVLSQFNQDELLLFLERDADRIAAGKISFVADARQKELLSSLNSSIGNSTLGKVKHVDVVDGVISELHMSVKDSAWIDTNAVSVSLPILVNIRTGADESFLQALGCLANGFREQSDILSLRQDELKNGQVKKSVTELESILEKAYSAYVSERGGKGVQLTESFFKSLQMAELAHDYPIANYLMKRDRYLLTKKTLSANEELSLNDSRLQVLKKVLPYLKTRLQGALFAHESLSKLSVAEMDKLIRLMLQLRGQDIPTDTDMKALQKLAMSSQDNQLVADQIQYSILAQSLAALKLSLGQR